MKVNDQYYGALVERGEIVEVSEGKYRVSSYSRYGIVTDFVKAIGNQTYSEGDRVLFVMFPDGDGRIIDEL